MTVLMKKVSLLIVNKLLMFNSYFLEESHLQNFLAATGNEMNSNLQVCILTTKHKLVAPIPQMASFHAYYHPSSHHHCQAPVPSALITLATTTLTTNCYCNCTYHYNHSLPPPPPPQQLQIDPLLQSVASLLQ